jgi:hypothetical protein
MEQQKPERQKHKAQEAKPKITEAIANRLMDGRDILLTSNSGSFVTTPPYCLPSRHV